MSFLACFLLSAKRCRRIIDSPFIRRFLCLTCGIALDSVVRGHLIPCDLGFPIFGTWVGEGPKAELLSGAYFFPRWINSELIVPSRVFASLPPVTLG